MNGWLLIGICLAASAALLLAKPLIFRALDRISGRKRDASRHDQGV